MQPEGLLRLARILDRELLARRLGLLPGQLPASLTPEQLTALHSLAAERAGDIVRALLEEAAACDDVTDTASALAYLEDRLAFLGEVLSEETRQRVRGGFAAVAWGWGQRRLEAGRLRLEVESAGVYACRGDL